MVNPGRKTIFRCTWKVVLTMVLAFSADAQTLMPFFSYQGRAFDTNGTSPLLRTVDIKIQIRSSNGACVLYEEQQSSINLASSQGYFNLNLGSRWVMPKELGPIRDFPWRESFRTRAK